MNITRSTADAILEALNTSARSAITRFQSEIDAQGHNNTGKLRGSFEVQTRGISGGAQADILVEGYGRFVDQGVKANRIPYSGRSGRGGKSKYIEGLRGYFQSKGLGATEALRAAFATAAKQRREGMPTRGSFKYSRNGKRTDFIGSQVPEIETELAQNIERVVSDTLEIQIALAFR